MCILKSLQVRDRVTSRVKLMRSIWKFSLYWVECICSCRSWHHVNRTRDVWAVVTSEMASHAELVSELASVDKMPMSDRLKLAKKRRTAQLKAYAQYEKQLNKNASRRGKKASATAALACSSSSSRTRIQLKFTDSVLLLDATVRNDVDEGIALGSWTFTSRIVFNTYITRYNTLHVFATRQ